MDTAVLELLSHLTGQVHAVDHAADLVTREDGNVRHGRDQHRPTEFAPAVDEILTRLESGSARSTPPERVRGCDLLAVHGFGRGRHEGAHVGENVLRRAWMILPQNR